jgi:hypothetical protein
VTKSWTDERKGGEATGIWREREKRALMHKYPDWKRKYSEVDRRYIVEGKL